MSMLWEEIIPRIVTKAGLLQEGFVPATGLKNHPN
jgi:hypothetical protein